MEKKPTPVERAAANRRHLDAVLGMSSESIVLADADGAINYMSPGAELLLGHDRLEVVGQLVFDFVHPDDLARISQVFTQRIDFEGDDTGAPLRARHRGGEWIEVVATASLMPADSKSAMALRLVPVGGAADVELALRERIAVEEFLTRLTISLLDLASTTELQDRLEQGLSDINMLAGSQIAYTFVERKQEGVVEEVASSWAPGWEPSGDRRIPIAELGQDMVDYILDVQRTVQGVDSAADQVRRATEQGVVGILSAPFATTEERGAVVMIRLQEGPRWTAADEALVRQVAALVGTSIERARAEELLWHTFHDGPLSIGIRNSRAELVGCNNLWVESTGISREEALGSGLDVVVHPDDLETVTGKFDELVATGRPTEWVLRTTNAEGFIRFSHSRGVLLDQVGSEESLVLVVSEDVTERERQRSLLEASQSETQRIMDNVPALIFRVERDSTIVFSGPEAERISGIPTESFVGSQMLDFIIDPATSEIWTEGLQRVFERGESASYEMRVPTGRTELVLDARAVPEYGPDGEVETALILALDITERMQIAERLEHAATHDSLTGIANRAAMLDFIERSYAENRVPSLLIIDLDNFKQVNDMLGHTGGDVVLQVISERMRTTVRADDLLARLGGDEFAVVLPKGGLEGVERLTQRLRASLNQPIVVEDRRFPMTFSVGAALGEPGLSQAELMVRADRALYSAKKKGRDQVVVFDDTLRDEVLARLTLERELRDAIDFDQLDMWFQPEFSVDTMTIVGCEALLRWNHPDRGVLMAAEFIEIAEKTGLIEEIGRSALRAACHRFAQVTEATGRHDLTLRVNISAREFARPELPDLVRSAVEDAGLSPDRLCLEMTETTLMDSPDIALATLSRLHEIGVEFAIDDFGTGYSSFTYLQRLPVDAVKIDRSFIAELTVDPDSRAIVESILSLGRSLSLEVVAEGVETVEQLDLLRQLGCERAQGYLVSPAVPAEKFQRLVTRSDAAAPAGRTTG